MENQITRRKHAFSAILFLTILLCVLSADSLAKKEKKSKDKKKAESVQPVQLDRTIGDLAEVVAFNPIPVKGIGLVVGLPGTGSSECPPDMRDYLRKYILTQVGRKDIVNPDLMINSTDTAIVLVEGRIPPASSKYQAFDISVKALPNTQTTSLVGGRLYTTDLKIIARIEESYTSSKTLALAAGPVFIDRISNPKPDVLSGTVLGGGKALEDYQVTLALYKPDFKAAAYIRNRINQRFGRDVANATSESIINLSVPQNFRKNKERFIELVKSLYIASASANESIHIDKLVNQLATAGNKTKYQTALEAIGKPAVEKLIPLLDSNDIPVKFAAAKSILAIGDDKSLKTLRDFAQDSASPFRIEAIQTIGEYAYKNDVAALMGRLIRDDNFDVRYNAYTYLRKINDTSIIRTVVSEDFFIDQVISTGPKTIYVSRKMQPGIIIFGSPIDSEKGIYIESDDGQIIINSQPTDDRLSILRKHPLTGGLMGPLNCSTRLVDIIKLLGDQPKPEDDKKRPGLGVPYADIIAILKNMVDKGAVKADFVAGELSKY